MKKRSRVDIYATIIEVLKRYPLGATITKIMYAAEIPHSRAKKYIQKLVENGLIKPSLEDARRYVVTSRGLEFLEVYYKMREFMDVFE